MRYVKRIRIPAAGPRQEPGELPHSKRHVGNLEGPETNWLLKQSNLW